MEATTTRASTVIRSMPTSDTRTQASITMPLSSTRSRTSMRLVPAPVRSTGIGAPAGSAPPFRPCARKLLDLPLELADLLAQLLVFPDQPALAPGRQVPVVAPPIEPDLLRLIKRTDEQADPNRQQLDFGQRHFDVAGNHQA